MKENDLKHAVKERVEASGGRLFEISFFQKSGFPRYLVIFPGGHIGFVEIGKPDQKRISDLKEQISVLQTFGCAACMVGEKCQINRMVMYILSDAGKDASWNAYQDYKERMLKER